MEGVGTIMLAKWGEPTKMYKKITVIWHKNHMIIKTEWSEGPKGPHIARFLHKFRPYTQSTHRTGNDPPQKFVFLDVLGHLKAKWAEIWSEDRFLIDGSGDFDFGHFWPFLAELWQKN